MPRRFLPEMRAVAADTHIEFDALSAMPGFDTRRRQRDRRAGTRVQRRRRPWQGVVRHRGLAVPRGRDIPTIICGPGHIAQAHQPNEWVSARAARPLRGVHASARGPRLCVDADAVTPATRVRRRRRRSRRIAADRGRVSRSRALGGRQHAAFPTCGRFAASRPGPHLLVQALTHGNEVCGAIALDWLLATGIRPVRGTLSLVLRQRRRLPTLRPGRAVCVALRRRGLQPAVDAGGARRSPRRARTSIARASCGRSTTRADYLLDLHSMTDPCPPLAMAGRQRKGVALAQCARHARAHRRRRRARRRPAAARLRVLRRPGRSAQRAARSNAASTGKRGAGRRAPGDAALPARISAWPMRRCSHAQLERQPRPGAAGDRSDRRGDDRQRRLRLRDSGARSADRSRAREPLLRATTAAPRSATPHDDCVLIMPTRRPKRGETAVRLGRYID